MMIQSSSLRGVPLLACLVVLAAVSLAVPRPAYGQNSEERAQAQSLFQSGVAHLNESDFAAAIDDLEQARGLYPTAPIFFNLGLAYQGAGRSVDAIHAFERFLAAAGETVDEERAAEVGRNLRTLRARLGVLRLDITPPTAIVHVDDELVARGTARVELDPGEHHIRVSAEGLQQVERDVTVEPGGEELLQVALEEGDNSGTLILDVQPDESMVRIDGRARGRGDLTLELIEGPHTVYAEFEGEGATEDVIIERGQELSLSLEISQRKSLAWVGIVVGILVVGAAAGTIGYLVRNPSDEEPIDGDLGVVTTALWSPLGAR